MRAAADDGDPAGRANPVDAPDGRASCGLKVEDAVMQEVVRQLGGVVETLLDIGLSYDTELPEVSSYVTDVADQVARLTVEALRLWPAARA